MVTTKKDAREHFDEETSHRQIEILLGTMMGWITASVNSIWAENWEDCSKEDIREIVNGECFEILTSIYTMGELITDHWHDVYSIADAMDDADKQKVKLLNVMSRFKEE